MTKRIAIVCAVGGCIEVLMTALLALRYDTIYEESEFLLDDYSMAPFVIGVIGGFGFIGLSVILIIVSRRAKL